jgi:hypothetical protein
MLDADFAKGFQGFRVDESGRLCPGAECLPAIAQPGIHNGLRHLRPAGISGTEK